MSSNFWTLVSLPLLDNVLIPIRLDALKIYFNKSNGQKYGYLISTNHRLSKRNLNRISIYFNEIFKLFASFQLILWNSILYFVMKKSKTRSPWIIKLVRKHLDYLCNFPYPFYKAVLTCHWKWQSEAIICTKINGMHWKETTSRTTAG